MPEEEKGVGELTEPVLFGERLKLPNAEQYMRWLAKFAWKETWGKVVANPFITVLLSAVTAAVSIFIQRSLGRISPYQMIDGLLSILIGCASVGIIFLAVYLVHFFYLSPKYLCLDAKKQRDSLRSELDASYDLRLKRRQEARETTFQNCVAMLKSPRPIFPLNAIVRNQAFNLEENDDVIWLCDEIGKKRCGHPFAELLPYVPKSDWKEFLRWAHFIADYDLINGDDFRDAAERWRFDHNYPLPPKEQQIAEIYHGEETMPLPPIFDTEEPPPRST
jgi:hypothetical protein